MYGIIKTYGKNLGSNNCEEQKKNRKIQQTQNQVTDKSYEKRGVTWREAKKLEKYQKKWRRL